MLRILFQVIQKRELARSIREYKGIICFANKLVVVPCVEFQES